MASSHSLSVAGGRSSKDQLGVVGAAEHRVVGMAGMVKGREEDWWKAGQKGWRSVGLHSSRYTVEFKVDPMIEMMGGEKLKHPL